MWAAYTGVMADAQPAMGPGDRPFAQEDRFRVALILDTAFTPGSPVQTKDVFAGRTEQIRRVILAMRQTGKSVLIYGERGVGKTSLANVISEIYLSNAAARIFAPHISCDGGDTFHQVWMKIVNMRVEKNKPNVKLPEATSREIDAILHSANGRLTPHHVRQIADAVARTQLMIPIIDEFDRIQDEETITLFTDTIKYISDHVKNTTIILLGVGDTVDDLIREHQSVERALEQVLMPRMNNVESLQILQNGEEVTGIKFTKDAADLIVTLAQGLPHITHLLGLNGTMAAIDSASWVVTNDHIRTAIRTAISGNLMSLQRKYHTATQSPRKDNLFREVLLACALAPNDDLGYFAASDVRAPFQRITGKPYDIPNYAQHLKAFCEEERGSILQRTGPTRRTRFRFEHPMMQPFVVMNGLKDGHISQEEVQAMLQARRYFLQS